jgi:hypothetical protein
MEHAKFLESQALVSGTKSLLCILLGKASQPDSTGCVCVCAEDGGINPTL